MKRDSLIREYAKSIGFDVVGKLKREPDVRYGMKRESHYPLWTDEAGNAYCGSYSKTEKYCIITADDRVY